MDRSMIDQYGAGSQRLREAVGGLAPADLRATPPADAATDVGRWSIQQVVIHLADAELVYVERMRRVIAEENPPLRAFDQACWAERMAYDQQLAEDAVLLVEVLRRQTARVLAAQPSEAFTRRGIHNEAGPVTLGDLLTASIEHLEHHVRFIENKRRWLGW